MEVALDMWTRVGNLNIKKLFIDLELAEKQALDESHSDAAREDWLMGLRDVLWCFVQKDLSDPEQWTQAWDDLEGPYSAAVIQRCYGIKLTTSPEDIPRGKKGEMKKHSRTAKDGLKAKQRCTRMSIYHAVSVVVLLVMWAISFMLFLHVFGDLISEWVGCLGWFSIVCILSLAVPLVCMWTGFCCFGLLVAMRHAR